MESFLKFVKALSQILHVIAGVSLTFLVALTLVDVILRGFNSPIVGTYELVALAGGVAAGFALPSTSWFRQQVYIDFFIDKLGRKVKNAVNVATRVLVTALFIIIGWNLMEYGAGLRKSGEVTLTLQIPFYPVAYGIGMCCFIQCLVMVCDIIRIYRGEYE